MARWGFLVIYARSIIFPLCFHSNTTPLIFQAFVLICVAQNQGIVAAIELGRQKRAQLETTIVKSAEMINDSVKLRDEKIVQALLDQGKAAQKEVQE